MLVNIFILVCSLAFIMKGATLATKYAALLAKNFHLSKYTVGFIIIAVISVLPEMFISIDAALKGVPSFGLGTLFGSNVADMTLVFAVILFLTGRNLKVESKILKHRKLYPIFLLMPLILGLDGFVGRSDGLALIIMGGIFYYLALKDGVYNKVLAQESDKVINLLLLLLGMTMLLVGSHFTVLSATDLAYSLNISPILIGMVVVGVGTTIPELFFSLKSIKKDDDSLAIGDILGTVLADATIVVGIIALIKPFFFPTTIIYITGMFMVLSSVLLYHFIHTGKNLTKKEAGILFLFWLVFVLTEFIVNEFIVN